MDKPTMFDRYTRPGVLDAVTSASESESLNAAPDRSKLGITVAASRGRGGVGGGVEGGADAVESGR